jgi:GH24 family phage-related lysozyme (muramidase)
MYMEIVESILTKNPCYRTGKKIKVKGLMLHSVGCPQPSAKVFIDKWDNPNEGRACVHAFIDGNTAVVYQTLPWDYRAWHCGGKANDTHIGVEMCEPSCIHYTGGASFDCSNMEAAMQVVKRTYDTAVELFAYLCKKFGLNPLEDGVIISHKEGHDRKLATGHGDPDHLWGGLHCEYTMDGFRQAVAEKMKMEIVEVTEPEAEEKENDNIKDNIIKENDVVALAPDAVYYSGGAIPGWVLSDKWIVKSVAGDRAVLGSNLSGTNNISSPVNVKYLIKDIGETMKNPQPVAPIAAPVSSGEMAVSDVGVALIAKYEGCRLEAYKCPSGVWTIGYGHTQNVNSGDTLASQNDAEALLKEDLKKYGGYVNECIKDGLITFPINQNQFDALTSFCYNCGRGNLKKLVKDRDEQAVADALLKYVTGGGKVLNGLVRRREEEKELFLKRG